MNDLRIENIGQSLEIADGISAAREKREMMQQSAGSAAGETPSGSFTEMLNKAVEKTNELQVQGDKASAELMAGRTKNIHESLLVLERADLSLKLMMQVRNKVLDAYKEIMRMQV